MKLYKKTGYGEEVVLEEATFDDVKKWLREQHDFFNGDEGYIPVSKKALERALIDLNNAVERG